MLLLLLLRRQLHRGNLRVELLLRVDLHLRVELMLLLLLLLVELLYSLIHFALNPA
jgi:hypothetical protein